MISVLYTVNSRCLHVIQEEKSNRELDNLELRREGRADAICLCGITVQMEALNYQIDEVAQESEEEKWVWDRIPRDTKP